MERNLKRLLILVVTGSLILTVWGAATATSKEKLTVWLPPFGDATEHLEKGFSLFEKENPNIEVNSEEISWGNYEDKWMTSIAAGVAADLGYMYDVMLAPFAAMGALEPLDAYITDEYRDEIYESLWDSLKYKGKTYGVPFLGMTYPLWYNVDMFREAGIEGPPDTHDEFLKVTKKLTKDIDGDGKTDEYGFGVAFNTITLHIIYPFFFQNGVEIVSEDGAKAAFNTKEGLEVLQGLVDMMYKDRIMPEACLGLGQGEVTELFLSGKIAMKYESRKNVDNPEIRARYPDLKIGVMLIPKRKNRSSYGGLGFFIIIPGSKHKEAALKLIQFMTTEKEFQEDFMRAIQIFPSAKAFVGIYADDPIQNLIAEQLGYAHAMPVSEKAVEIEHILIGEIQAAMSRLKTAEQALADAELKVNEALARR